MKVPKSVYVSNAAVLANMGSSKSDDDKVLAELKSKSQHRVTNLGHIDSALNEVKTKLSSLYVVPVGKQLKILKSSIDKIEAINSTKGKPQGVTVPLRKVSNELTSLRSAIKANADSLDENFYDLPEINEALEVVQALKGRAEVRAEDIFKMSSDDKYEQAIKKAEQIIKNNQKKSKVLESIKGLPFVIVRLPIVAVTKPRMNVDKLKRGGINAEDLVGYPMINNQLVIGISKEALETKKSKAMDVADSYRKLLSKNVGRKLVFVSDKPSRAKGALWFWVSTERELNVMLKSAGGNMKIERWDFAIN